ncbi:SDR family NAD(P)-dependent oxidoreductase [Halieaceae bacterium IMCC14734]|uniref:SDR family NAD(P)-dependent oxidoreductase n=1 Tax=Candidatus Litorirhabdus singularis TaxID=2518993 RepID=A0ABT3TBU6_9GAMM|nr:SDR family NAD(P)-dependent oxidoreductase [Candidatus Litorirhabdus singularis]MCX2979735.1 SDR family NAD(P)-dependent oxidoreductase [Candidatus Litorirhabdus singularis]
MNVLIVGGSGGIGLELANAMSARPDVDNVVATYRRQVPEHAATGIDWLQLDVTNQDQLAECWPAEKPLDYLIYAVGLLHDGNTGPEKTVRRIDPDLFSKSMQINALPVLLLAQSLHKSFKLSDSPKLAAVSARVGSIEENRSGGWYSYRCSKAALNMALKTLALEWRMAMPKGAVAALHPGTTDTALSRPFQANVPTEKLFTGAQTAAYLLTVIDQLTPDNSGRFWSWDGTELPW